MNESRWLVGLVGSLIAAAYLAFVMSGASWQPSALLAIGDEAVVQLEYANRVLEGRVETRSALGHDGKFFFILANDPLFLAPAEHAAFLDYPTYRAQRILYPLVAGGVGLFSAGMTVWGLIVVNVLAAGLGSYATAGVAGFLGTTRWLGLAYVISPGIIAELDIDGGGVLALALGMLGLLLLLKKEESWAIAAFAGSVLARETMILFVGGLFLWEWLYRRSLRVALLAIPVIGAIAWRVYAGIRLAGIESSSSMSQGLLRSFDLPLRGMIEASAVWAMDSVKLIWTLCLITLLLLFLRRAWTDRSPLAACASPFLVLSLFLSAIVWIEPYDIARALAPVFVAYPLLLFSKKPSEVGT